VTSFQVVAHLRRVLRVPKIGHGGTLDPEATGVLPILIGEATKLTPYMIDLDKEYVATVRLGITTETQDLSGTVVATAPVPALEAAQVEAALGPFVGVIRQVPPMYSALRRDGKRLYELAREGRTVEREAREVTVHAIALVSLSLPDLVLRVRCGKGTYIRTLAADLGAALGCGAALAGLVRTRVGPYALEDAVPWTDVRDARHGAPLWARVLPVDSPLASFPPVRLDAVQTRAFSHGQTVTVAAAPPGRVRVYGADGGLLGIALAGGALVRPERCLHADPPRPSVLPA
jgi:tRNA pseudouridine55 synthase